MTLTITLEGEDAARVTAEAHRRGVEPDDVVRESLRKTLEAKTPFKVRPFELGPATIDLTCTSAVLGFLDELEAEEKARRQ